jgi:hypothetical protein
MYEEIRRPKLLKPIPLIIIRSLSSLYYFAKYIQNSAPEKSQRIFSSNIEFLFTLLDILGKEFKQKQFFDLARRINQLINEKNTNLLQNLEKITIDLAGFCDNYQNAIHQAMKVLREQIVNMYKQKVTKIQVVVVDNDNDPAGTEKIANILHNFCHYQVEKTKYPSSDYSGKMVNSDFTFITSTHPPQIHELVKSLKTYKKPGLAIAHIEKEGKANEQAIRHGAQLQRGGFPVLFKIFTPIRLFTSIDKIYMKYNLKN